MNPIVRFIKRSLKSGGFIIDDAISLLQARKQAGTQMNRYFMFKDLYNGDRNAWKKYIPDSLAEECRALNGPEVQDIFTDKALFDTKFARFLGREWILPAETDAETFYAFLKKNPEAVAKPRRGQRGSGIEILGTPENVEEAEKWRARLADEDMLVEEHLKQHPVMSELYGLSINTIRMTTFYTENGPVLVAPLMRIGAGGCRADNFDAGGVLAMLEPETGIMRTGAMNKKYVWFDKHPETGKSFAGFQVPCWKELQEMCLKAAEIVPEAPYIGWDVGITPNGPVLVEGNVRPSVNWQFSDKRGWHKEFRQYCDSAKRRKAKLKA